MYLLLQYTIRLATTGYEEVEWGSLQIDLIQKKTNHSSAYRNRNKNQ
jgi:hypothetical protein